MKKSPIPILTALALSLVIACAQAQTYPTKPVKLVVGFPPGAADTVAAAIVRADTARYAKVVKDAGLKLD